MALKSNALASVANVKSFLGITVATYDSLIELLINGCSEWIENEISRVIKDDGNDVVELYDGDFDSSGRCQISTRKWPINSITKIEYATGDLGSPTWTEFDSSNYTYDAIAGIIYFTASLSSILPNRQNIRVTYQGGFTSGNEPSDLELACIKMTAKEFDKRKSQGVTQESVGGGTVTWNEQVDPEVLKIIRKYRRYL
jgi:hypothetical protein